MRDFLILNLMVRKVTARLLKVNVLCDMLTSIWASSSNTHVVKTNLTSFCSTLCDNFLPDFRTYCVLNEDGETCRKVH